MTTTGRPAARYARVRPPRAREDAESVTPTVNPTTEKELTADVMALLKATGWLAYHTFDSRRSNPGFPDVVALKGSRLLALELKSARGTATRAQYEWLVAFSEIGEAYIVRPSNWDELVAIVSF